MGRRRRELAEDPALAECLKAGLLCNDAQLVQTEGRWQAEGDPTEAALIVVARKAGLPTTAAIATAHPRLDAIPFESEHQFMATLHGGGHGRQRVIYKKGATERLIERCENALGADGEPSRSTAERVHEAVERMASKGLRVLAFARRETHPEHAHLEHDHVAGGLTFLGLAGNDRPSAARSDRRPSGAAAAPGIRVKMITGDHLATARAIARQIELGDPKRANRRRERP